jgi:hypothetical protein
VKLCNPFSTAISPSKILIGKRKKMAANIPEKMAKTRNGFLNTFSMLTTIVCVG